MSAEWGIVSAECWISFMMNEEDNANDGKSQQGWSPSMSSVHSWQDHAGQSDSALKLLPPGHVKAAVKLALTGGNWSIGGMGRTTVGRVLHVFFTNIRSKVHICIYMVQKQTTCYSMFSHLFQSSFHDVHDCCFSWNLSRIAGFDHRPWPVPALCFAKARSKGHGMGWDDTLSHPLKVLLGRWGNKPKEGVVFLRTSNS